MSAFVRWDALLIYGIYIDLDFSALEYSYIGRAVSGFNDCGELLALFDSVWCIAVDA